MNNRAVNKFKCVFLAKSVNEGFARSVMAAFAGQLDPKVGDIADIKTAVSEAVTNCIVHAYKNSELPPDKRLIELQGAYFGDGRLVMVVKDRGVGISNIKQAMEPLFTTDPEGERSGMGFTVMESFTDKIQVRSRPGHGTTVRLIKNIAIT